MSENSRDRETSGLKGSRLQGSSRRCEQCGREGTREFTVLGGYWDHAMSPEDSELVWVPFITICANRAACQRRWPREAEDVREARLA